MLSLFSSPYASIRSSVSPARPLTLVQTATICTAFPRAACAPQLGQRRGPLHQGCAEVSLCPVGQNRDDVALDPGGQLARRPDVRPGRDAYQ